MNTSKLCQEPATELEMGEIRRNPEVVHQVLVQLQKSDDSRKKTPVITSALPTKIEKGLSSQPPSNCERKFVETFLLIYS